MMRKGRIKLTILMIAFAVSLYSISKVMGPLIALASGDTTSIQEGLVAKLLPTLFGESTTDLEMLGDGSLAQLEDMLKQSSNEIDPSKSLGLGSAAGISNPNQLLGPNGLGSSSSQTGNSPTSARLITKNSSQRSGSNEIDPDRIEMTNVRDVGLDPELEKSLRASAIALHMEGKLEKAVEAYHKEIAREPSKARLRSNLAVALYQLERYDEAWDEVHEAQRLGGSPPAAFVKALRKKMSEPNS